MADKFIKFNLNDHIKVRLNDKGYQHMADINNSYADEFPNTFERRDADYYRAMADKDGYTTFQAWSFIQDFGETISIGISNYFDLDILIKNK